ncbi:MAG: MFS transporter [Thermoplasmata archaeon]
MQKGNSDSFHGYSERQIHARSITFTSLGHLSNDLNLLLFSVLITYYYKDFGISLAVLGAVAILYNVFSGLLSTPVGRYADRTRHYRWLITLGLVIIGLSVVIFAFSFKLSGMVLPLMIVSAVVLGVGQAFYHPIGASILHLSYREKAASALGINGSFGSIGRSVLPIVLVPLIALYGEFHALLFLAAYMFIAALIIYSGLSYLKDQEVAHDDSNNVSENKNRKVQLGKYRGVLTILVMIVFIRAMFMTGTTTYISQYLVEKLHSEVIMSYVLTISFITAVVGQPVFGKITEMNGGKFSIIITTIFSAVFFVFFMLSGSNAVLDTISYALFVFMAFTGFPVLLGYVGQIVPKEISTTSNGLVWGLGNTVGGGAGIGVMSLLLLRISLTDTMWIMLVFAVISIVMLPLLPKRIKANKPAASP